LTAPLASEIDWSSSARALMHFRSRSPKSAFVSSSDAQLTVVNLASMAFFAAKVENERILQWHLVARKQ
jgi:hypothetical protein